MKTLLAASLLSIGFVSNAQVNNYSIQLDGTDDYIQYNNVISIPNFPISVQADVYLPANFQSMTEFSIFKSDDHSGPYSGFWCAIKPTFIELSYGDGNGEGTQYRRTINSPHSIIAQTWVNIACVINGPLDMKVYVDGVDVGGTYTGGGGTYFPSYGNLATSGYAISSASTLYSEGQIDNLSIWDIALTPTSVSDYMDCPPIGTENGLVALWHFEEGSGITSQDLTGNGHTGNLMNGATWSGNAPSNICNVGINEMASTTSNATLIKIVDQLGRETPYKENTPLILIYSDGTHERVMHLSE